MRIKWIAYPSTWQEKRESNEYSFSDQVTIEGKTKMVYFRQWFFTERTTKRKQNKEISFQEEGNWIQVRNKVHEAMVGIPKYVGKSKQEMTVWSSNYYNSNDYHDNHF